MIMQCMFSIQLVYQENNQRPVDRTRHPIKSPRPNRTSVKSDYHSDPTLPLARPKGRLLWYKAQTTINHYKNTTSGKRTYVEILNHSKTPQYSSRNQDGSKEGY